MTMTTTQKITASSSSTSSNTDSQSITTTITPPPITTAVDQSQQTQQQQVKDKDDDDDDDDEWNKRLQELQDFKKRHGHSIVPPSWSEQQGLSEWVYKQRTAATQERLGNAQKMQLEQLGVFLFNHKDQKWQEMLHRLYQFWNVTGHFQVPSHQSTEMNTLRTWLSEQRRYYRRGTLRSDRQLALEAIGFVVWNPRKGNPSSSTASTAAAAATPLVGNINAQSSPPQQQQRGIKRTDHDTAVSSHDSKRQNMATIMPEFVVSMVKEIPSVASLEKKRPSTMNPSSRHCSIVSSLPFKGTKGTTTAEAAADPAAAADAQMTRSNHPSLATSTTIRTFPSNQDSTALSLQPRKMSMTTRTSTTPSIVVTHIALSQSKGVIATEYTEKEEEAQQDGINLCHKNYEGHEGDSNHEKEKQDNKATELFTPGVTTRVALPQSELSNQSRSPTSSASSSPSAPLELEQAPDTEEQQPSHEPGKQQEQQEQKRPQQQEQQQQQRQPQNPQGDDEDEDEYIQVTPNLCAALLFSFHAQHSHFNIPPNDEPCYNYLQQIRSGHMVPDDAVRLALLLKGFVFDDPDSTRDLLEHGMQQFLAHQINQRRKSHPTAPVAAAAPAATAITSTTTEMPQWLRLWENCVRQDCLPISRTKKSYLTAVGFDWGRDEVKVEDE
jgi:hypothetical protein